jgi:hypothetical protein
VEIGPFKEACSERGDLGIQRHPIGIIPPQGRETKVPHFGRGLSGVVLPMCIVDRHGNPLITGGIKMASGLHSDLDRTVTGGSMKLVKLVMLGVGLGLLSGATPVYADESVPPSGGEVSPVRPVEQDKQAVQSAHEKVKQDKTQLKQDRKTLKAARKKAHADGKEEKKDDKSAPQPSTPPESK